MSKNKKIKLLINSIAGEDEAKVFIDVMTPPKIYEFSNITQSVDNEAKIICKANGHPPPEITFRYTNIRFIK